MDLPILFPPGSWKQVLICCGSVRNWPSIVLQSSTSPSLSRIHENLLIIKQPIIIQNAWEPVRLLERPSIVLLQRLWSHWTQLPGHCSWHPLESFQCHPTHYQNGSSGNIYGTLGTAIGFLFLGLAGVAWAGTGAGGSGTPGSVFGLRDFFYEIWLKQEILKSADMRIHCCVENVNNFPYHFRRLSENKYRQIIWLGSRLTESSFWLQRCLFWRRWGAASDFLGCCDHLYL